MTQAPQGSPDPADPADSQHPEPVDGAAEATETPTGGSAASAPAGSFGDVAGMGPVEGEPVEPPIGEPASEAAYDGGSTADQQDGAAAEVDAARTALAERTLDLQRLQAEYLNYKRRVDRDREVLRQNATYTALAPIVEVLDTVDRAREHEEITGGFKSVVDQLERVVTGLGLSKFGAPGDAFDPVRHEALSHLGAEEGIEVTTVKVVAKAGYAIGDRVVRAAQVLVVDPVG